VKSPTLGSSGSEKAPRGISLGAATESFVSYFDDIKEEEIVNSANLRLVRAFGKLGNIVLHKGCTFYCKPWGAPLLVAVDDFKIKIDGDSFIHHSTQLHATGGSITIGRYSDVSWRVAFLTRYGNEFNSEPIRNSNSEYVNELSLERDSPGSRPIGGLLAASRHSSSCDSIASSAPTNMTFNSGLFSGSQSSTDLEENLYFCSIEDTEPNPNPDWRSLCPSSRLRILHLIFLITP